MTLAFEYTGWWVSAVKILVATIAVPTGAAIAVYLFLFKLISFMQSRLGPMEAGPHGTLQLVAEVGKWLQKEDLIPDAADKRASSTCSPCRRCR